MTFRLPVIFALLACVVSAFSGTSSVSARGLDRTRHQDSRAWNSGWDSRGHGEFKGGSACRDRDHDHSARSYYYEDPYCGLRSSHVSDFKRHYERAGHGLMILKVDIRSGRVLDRYRYDCEQQEWRDWDRHSGRDDDDDRYDRRRRSRDRDD